MKPKNLEEIHRSFAVQAANFESKSMNFSKAEYLQYMVDRIAPRKEDTVLEVAAGTCVCGRAFAPHVKTMVCIDATVPMLSRGREEANRKGLDNMIFIKGYAEELPFLPESFDVVYSRLAFHHFTAPEAAFAEMVRVLKPGGRLVMIDMEAAHEEDRARRDEIEILRDPSHVRNLSRPEMEALFGRYGLPLEIGDVTEIPQQLKSWMELTKTPEAVKADIVKCMEEDLAGGERTGFYPYRQDGEIWFRQHWVLLAGRKPE